MAFELYEKKQRSAPLENDEVGVNTRGIVINSELSKRFQKPYVEVYLDSENKAVGLKTSDDANKGYSVVGDDVKSVMGAFLKKIPKGRYKVKSEKGLYVFNVESFITQ